MVKAIERIPSGSHDTGEIAEFRARTLGWVLVALPGLAMAIVLAFAAAYERVALATGVLVPALLGLAALGHGLRERRAVLAAWSVTIGLHLALVAVTLLQDSTAFLPLFVLHVLVAAAVLGPSQASWVAAASVGTIALVAPFGVDALVAVALVIGGTALAQALTHPAYRALDWAWEHYRAAQDAAEALRDRQAELGRVVKSLHETHLRLERLNGELARARRVAEEARRVKGEFAATISHELRTPINLVVGFAEMMASSPRAYGGAVLPAAYRRDLDAIQRNARHLSGLIDDVLDLGQIEVGRMGLHKEPVAVGEVVAEAASVAARLLEGKGLSLDLRILPDLPEVHVDRTRVRQVLINLLGNAARFTDEGGVVVSAQERGSDVVVHVADTGIGIAAEDIPTVFEEFRQLDGSIRRRAGGSGLGLAVSKQFVELHGGSMWAESAPGRGTTISFSLPRATNVVAALAGRDGALWDGVAAGRQVDAPELRILGADESGADVRLIDRHLGGYRVTGGRGVGPGSADGAEPAAYLVVATGVDEAIRRAADAAPLGGGSPVLACVLPSRDDLARGIGAAAYLQKPVLREHLSDVLARLNVSPRSLLVVDDDPDMLRLMGRMARAALPRCRVATAASGDEALVLMRARRPDLVFLDLLMDVADGYAVLDAMRADARLRDVPVVVVTARAREEAPVVAQFLGVTRHGGLAVRDFVRCLQVTLDALVLENGPARRAPEAAPRA